MKAIIIGAGGRGMGYSNWACENRDKIQIVNMEFEDGITAVFSMCGFTPETSRTIKIMGTKGQIRATMYENIIEVTDFAEYKKRVISLNIAEGREGHGGGDSGLLKAFCEYIDYDKDNIGIASLRVTAENHMISFAAEESRVGGGKLVELK
ncbi:MAG: hypothetical protein IKB93_05945 [Clostridia bacterium]|nr:hypothetical protein [Clostridia bacterium]